MTSSSPPPRNTAFFSDMQNHLQNLTADISRIRINMDAAQPAFKRELAEIRKSIEDEAYESRDIANHLRYEMDELIHTRVQVLKDGLQEQLAHQNVKDRMQVAQIETVQTEVEKLQAHLARVAVPWREAKLNCLRRRPKVAELMRRARQAEHDETREAIDIHEPVRVVSITSGAMAASADGFYDIGEWD
eukprot:TRINITY_DN2667_c2_g1_i1.p1 TRINITY_DN2667_c2_g1~~TRINITY_DN2667_c2_g1_i1.p1  ORF type:complete len:189 (-),score=33.43 TRINITY_DN2667_c2_g1_i1:131-697(-)